ncbi:MAG: T9SS type B sorting domain-containing protein [Maribacter sp.]
MFKKIIFFLLLFACFLCKAQQCPVITNPANGTMDIPVDPTITWPAVDGINGYVISLGTTVGGKDIISSQSIGQNNFYTPPVGLPERTTIYITLSLVLFDGPPVVCSTSFFTTMDVTTSPPCTQLVAPDDKAANVTIVTDIVWGYSTTATGYRLSMGTTPNATDLVNNLDVGNVLVYDPLEDLPQGVDIYVTIIPYNENGNREPCVEENFSTGAEAFDCDPVVDEITGEVTNLKPQIDFPNRIGFCTNENPVISTSDTADGFRWFRTNEGSAETLISEGRTLTLSEPGRYRYEAYNIINVNGTSVECSDFKLFNVVASGPATIESIQVENLAAGKTISVFVSGVGQYEYALDSEDGPYEDNSVFENVIPGPHTVFVRDKNGCGVVNRTVDRNLSAKDFPNFFTPNADGINDFWQYVPPPQNFEFTLIGITIYDRYGSLLKQLDPQSLGWNGDFNGKSLPASDYWFKATFDNQKEVLGHFTLKR